MEELVSTARRVLGLFPTTMSTGSSERLSRIEAKARVVMPLKDQFYGMREFGIEDPDGYVIFFAQRIG